jgi:hypothetical protein
MIILIPIVLSICGIVATATIHSFVIAPIACTLVLGVYLYAEWPTFTRTGITPWAMTGIATLSINIAIFSPQSPILIYILPQAIQLGLLLI